jgi:hypothetical protein
MRAATAIFGSVLVGHVVASVALTTIEQGAGAMLGWMFALLFSLGFLLVSLPAALIHYAALWFVCRNSPKRLGTATALAFALFGGSLGVALVYLSTIGWADRSPAEHLIVSAGFAGLAASIFQSFVFGCALNRPENGEPAAAPNGGPGTHLDDAAVGGGPPSVS